MPKSLIIVESPTKVKTISKYVGKEYKVMATVGHVKDLPAGEIGVDIEANFKPTYITIPGKEKVFTDLVKNASKADEILLATDPDREGEAIAWHVSEAIDTKGNEKRIFRVLFHEMTRHGITEGLKKPGKLNNDLVQAQQARRILDRIVGYQVSPFLWKTITRGLSAGRVQSVVLRLICEREDEIEKFVTQEYWSIDADFSKGDSAPFTAKLAQIDGKKPELPDEKTTSGHIEKIGKEKFSISDLRTKEVKRTPNPPFITSTLQQEASRRFGITTSQVMRIAQQLYEGVDLGPEETVGLITYMRTDSVRISDEAVKSARAFIGAKFGKDFLPGSPRFYKGKKSAQDAHEAIRPTDVERTPESIKRFLSKEQFRLYELIWNRFLASQMTDALYMQSQADISGGRYLFRITSTTLQFQGFMRLFTDSTDEDDEEEKQGRIPEGVLVGDALRLGEIKPEQHFTKPPSRYSESTLVKELDALGIGRPSTYAPIIRNILTRNYIERQNKRLQPTELGRAISKILVSSFPAIFNVEFTSTMEDELDKIESGSKDSTSVLEEFYNPFQKSLSDVQSRKDEIKQTLQQETDEKCELCGSPMVLRYGRFGRFYACTAYPKCKGTKPYNNGQKEEAPQEVLEEKCTDCGSPLLLKRSRFGSRFIGCSGYPKCKYVRPFGTGVKCPKEGCGGEIVERQSKRGKIFYGCSLYPKCDFVSWKPVSAVPCENCGGPYLVERTTKKLGDHLYCPSCKAVVQKAVDSEVSDM